MSSVDWASLVHEALTDRVAAATLRHRRAVRILDSTHVSIDGVSLVNFSSNNYLGLTHHPRVMAAFENAAKSFGVGSGAAPLVTGQSESHDSAEKALAVWKQTESAVLLSSGYAANKAVVQTLAAVGNRTGTRARGNTPGVRFLIDKLCHASLVDGVRAVEGERSGFRVFPHNHLGKLRRLLEEADPAQMQVVVTESIFSMDGDAADLAGIAAMKEEFGFLLVVDEAHGSGVYGPGGAGYAAEVGVSKMVDISIITLSKALGCAGGAVCASGMLCEAIVNFGRSYVFSTAIPPAVAAAVEAAIGVMRDEPQRQRRVRELGAKVRSGLGHQPGDSPIIPVIFGEEDKTLKAAEQLSRQGILAVAVRPPTVPRGTSRLRVTVSCDHTDDDIAGLIRALHQNL
jgi:8-amino-7-oxononanoate synthase